MPRFHSFLLTVCLFTASHLVSGFHAAPTSPRPVFLLHSLSEPTSASSLYQPRERDNKYGSNVSQYLVDLDDSKATFNFCGGMMFQLMLTDALREYLSTTKEQPVIFDSSKPRMSNTPDYVRTSFADNVKWFHGREIRQVPTAEGGMGLVLQLSLADGNDPQGWTEGEIQGYDGWGHDSGRDWRTSDRLVKEGYVAFQEDFGKDAFTLHHRFYLHMDQGDHMWLSAEDGCEGTPQENGNANPIIAALQGLYQS